MHYFLGFLSIIGWVGFLSKRHPKLTSSLPLIVCVNIILVLYLFSFFGLLFWASKIILFGGLALALYCIVIVAQKSKLNPGKIFAIIRKVPSEFWVFVLLGIIWGFFIRDAVLHNSDEFFWARYAKLLFYNHGFGGKYGTLTDYGIIYPPALPLNQYFFLQFGQFSQKSLYFAQGILAFAALSYLFVLRKSNFRRNILLIVILISFLSYFLFSQFGFLSILSNHIIGIIFSVSVLISNFSLRSPKQKLLILPIIFLLILIKQNGIIFAYMLATFNIIHLWFFDKKMIKKATGIFLIVTLLLLPFLAYKSWYLYLSRFKTASNFRIERLIQSEDQPSIPSTEEGTDSKKVRVTKNFLRALIDKPINSAFQKDSAKIRALTKNNFILSAYLKYTNIERFSLLIWVTISLVLFFPVIFCLEGKRKITYKLLLASLVGGFIVHLLSILAAYTFFYPKREALELTSLVRYINAYTLGYFTALLGIVIIYADKIFIPKNANKWLPGIFVLSIVFIMQIPPINILYSYPIININMTNELKAGISPWVDLINSNTEERADIFVFTKFKDVESPILDYEIFPRRFGGGKYIRIHEEGKEDVWVNDLGVDAVKQLVKDGKFNYFFADRVDPSFWKEYAVLFENTEKAKSYRLFRVQTTNESGLRLIPYVN